MSDRYLNLVNSPLGAKVASTVGLPRPAAHGTEIVCTVTLIVCCGSVLCSSINEFSR